MQETFEVIPKEKLRVIDLLTEAKFDVSDWANFEGKYPSNNPKYCYEWSFIENDKIALCMWYDDVKKLKGAWSQALAPRTWGKAEDGTVLKSAWQKRSKEFEKAVSFANERGLPVRAILISGIRREVGNPDSKASVIGKRILDPLPWAITSYDRVTGNCTITRGVAPELFVDQFTDKENSPEKFSFIGQAYPRDPIVRREVRLRAMGKCELCGETGFLTANKQIYVETHHVIPLSEGGLDTVKNVVALCPNHHKEAHFSEKKSEMRTTLLNYLQSLN
jgi:hypothetical protein